jgi:regulatory protein
VGKRITDLKTDRRNNGRVSVYLDGHFAFSIKLIDSAGLNTGDRISNDKITFLKNEHEVYKAYSRALHYLSFRPRSQLETIQYLHGKGFSDSTINAVVDRLIKKNYLNDISFARFWVNNRKKNKPKARFLIRQELVQKGIDPDIAEAELGDLDDSETARNIVHSKLNRWSRLNPEALKKKVVNYLKTRGFKYHVSVDAYRHVCLPRN